MYVTELCAVQHIKVVYTEDKKHHAMQVGTISTGETEEEQTLGGALYYSLVNILLQLELYTQH